MMYPRITYLFVFFFLLHCVLGFLLGRDQANAKTAFASKAQYAILVDADTGAVLYSQKPDELMAPASMSKLTTVAIIFRELKAGRLTLENTFKVSVNAWRKGGAPSGTSAMFAPLNTEITLADLIPGIIVQSGNDACIIVAEGLAGNEGSFARMMEDEARKIGLTKSTFGNATGLPHPRQLMTARELAMLAAYLIKEYPEYYHYFSMKEFRYRIHRFINRNPLIFKYGADGLKTGSTKESGYGVVVSAVKDGRRLIGVVNGLESKRDRRVEAERLLDWGFTGFKEYQLFEPDVVVGHARVLGGSTSYVPLVGEKKKGAHALLPLYLSEKKVPARIVYEGPLKPPVKKGDQVAYLQVTTEGAVENKIPLFAAEDVARAGLFWRGFDTLLFRAFGWLF